ncbi:MAG: gephyrin-like molybdotransferase Glp [Betaproteobacteria bacterium]
MNELTVAEVLATLRARLTPLAERESVDLAAGMNRVLAADVVSAVDLPAFDNAAMDGYALRAADAGGPVTLRVVGHALAGHAHTGRVERGQAVRIMTGAALPAGADAVVMSEDTETAGDNVRVLRAARAGQNVRHRSEHVRAGEAVLIAGRRLRSHDIGLAASVGADTFTVWRRLRVAILSTGDELVDAPAPLAGSATYDGNRPLLAALVARAGADLIDLGISTDDDADFTARLGQAAHARADVLITTGGAAQGDADVVRKHGEVEFLPTDFRPGRGLLIGTVERSGHSMVLLGLPGNAVAAYVMYQLVARPLLGWLAGAGEEVPLTVQLPMAVDVHGKPGRIEWRRARFVQRYGAVALEPLKDQGSAMLRTLSEADALIAVPPPGVPAGEPIDAIPLAALD